MYYIINKSLILRTSKDYILKLKHNFIHDFNLIQI